MDADASGAATGLSWTDAFTNVQDALATALDGNEIWVAEGVYCPDEGVGQMNDDRNSTHQLVNGVALYGGFDPGSGIDEFVERDPETYITVLSGDIDHETQPDITDPNGVVTTTANIMGANAYHVVSSNGVDETTVLDGFAITAGQANGSSPDYAGGGMYNVGASNPTLTNVIFSGN